MATHKGTYKLKNPSKYIGDPDSVTYRSSWERSTFIWCEKNPRVMSWSSEETVVPYYSRTDNRLHRYFIDLTLQMTDGSKFIIEIKPAAQTKPPVKARGKARKKVISEALTYVKNQEKWSAARIWASQNGYQFQVWTEDVLKKIGVKIV